MSEKDWLIVEGAVRRGWNPEAVKALARLRARKEELEHIAMRDELEIERLRERIDSTREEAAT